LPSAGRPKFPRTISGDAKYIFRQLCKTLEARRTLTPGDGQLLALYAVAYDRQQRALTKIAEQGEICVYTRLDSNGTAHDVEKANLWLKVATDAERFMLSALDRLGLTPLNKGKVLPSVAKDDVVPGSLADLMRQQAAAPPAEPAPTPTPEIDLDRLLAETEFLN
jgi:P27 family predicted phage terminase small subunit